ncbi:hypothetical protein DCC79_13755 [bacterium]|nr:sigma-70 family RNA polymerase sigma factor [Chloroflexi bacterium CFX6]RIL08478.1 MAG: hypothetical protein DCC79_13755 [bacterium]
MASDPVTSAPTPLEAVAARCAGGDDPACYELFRRALALRDDRAWDALVRQYDRLVAAWARRHPRMPGCGSDVDDIVTDVYRRLWRAVAPERFADFAHVGQLLRFLKRAVHSAVVDCADRHPRGDETDVDDETDRPAADPDAGASAGALLWACLEPRLKTDKERLVCLGCFVYDLKPREMAAEWPGHFADAAEASYVRANLFERLQRDPDLRACLEDAGE